MKVNSITGEVWGTQAELESWFANHPMMAQQPTQAPQQTTCQSAPQVVYVPMNSHCGIPQGYCCCYHGNQQGQPSQGLDMSALLSYKLIAGL